MAIASSHPHLGRQVAKRLQPLGCQYASALEVLGIEVCYGRYLKYSRLRSRVQKTGKRLPRLQRVRSARHLCSKFAKQALPSAM
eukprot:1335678-Pyramimonas_sp.AAC.1